jgi:hypothetical protein
MYILPKTSCKANLQWAATQYGGDLIKTVTDT